MVYLGFKSVDHHSSTCTSTVLPTSCPRVPPLLSSTSTFAPMPRQLALLTSAATTLPSVKPDLSTLLRPTGFFTVSQGTQVTYFHTVADSFSLLPLFFRPLSFVFKGLRTLSAKTGGYGGCA